MFGKIIVSFLFIFCVNIAYANISSSKVKHFRVRQNIARKNIVKVNINKADLKAIQTLKGIGVKRAKAIIAYRKQHGAFKKIEDLTKVPGIGIKRLSKIKMNIVF